MKRIANLVILIFTLTAFSAFMAIDSVVNALKLGKVAEISSYFDQTVAITLPEHSNNYSKNQAEAVLRDFFQQNPVKGFEIMHKGEHTGSQYCIGTLHTRKFSYRTTVFMKQKSGRQWVQEIRIENK